MKPRILAVLRVKCDPLKRLQLINFCRSISTDIPSVRSSRRSFDSKRKSNLNRIANHHETNPVLIRTTAKHIPKTYQAVELLCKQNKLEEAIEAYMSIVDDAGISSTNDLEKIVNIPLEEHEAMIYQILRNYQHCTEIPKLFVLKLLWENYFSANTSSPNIELLYFSAYIHTMLNTGQVEAAQDLFKSTFTALTDGNDVNNHSMFDVLSTLPTIRLLDLLAADKHCDGLVKWLEIIHEVEDKVEDPSKKLIKYHHWLSYLNVGLSVSHYSLVRYIYDTIIMQGYEDAEITTENILFPDHTSIESTAKNTILDSINDETTLQILYTLALHGDVALTLTLIESHYIHKRMKGEKALTKELCVCIIESYCSSPDLHEWDSNSPASSTTNKDHSVELVLDVLDGFMKKLSKEGKDKITYRDITEFMSQKFNNYNVYDSKVEAHQQQRQLQEAQRVLESEVHTLKSKLQNVNIESSKQGNILANLNILSTFVVEHINYLQTEKNASTETITLFLNCVLNHVNKFQNLSGIIRVLTSVHKVNPNLVSEWLDDDLMNIILNAASKSSGAKMISFQLFKYLKNNSGKISHERYIWLISSIIRDDFHDSFQFYMYNYLLEHEGIMHPRMQELILNIPQLAIDTNVKTQQLIKFISNPDNCKVTYDESIKGVKSSQIEEIWASWELCKDYPVISGRPLPELNRKYYKSVDTRDLTYIKYLFET